MRSAIVLIVLVGSLALVGASSAATIHAIGFTKTCASPVEIGDPYRCTFGVQNDVDGSQDTLQITGLSDLVHAASGDQPSGNILSSVGLIFGGTGTVMCVGGSGAGTVGSPYIGATSCTLTFGATVQTTQFSHYAVQASDFTLPNHTLTDTGTLSWNNTCTFPGDTCTTATQTKTAEGSAVVQKLQSATATTIHNPAHQAVTSGSPGDVVHDFVTVTGSAQVPTGNVTIEWFSNGGCTGTAASSSTVGPLDAAGNLDAAGFAITVGNSSGAFRATYLGDGTYAGSTGPCETLFVPTAVRVASLQASRRPTGVLIRWRIGTETGVLGYNVYRERNGVRSRLNRKVIPAWGSIGGRSYSYLDRSVRRPRHQMRYWLEVVSTDGSRTLKVTQAP